MNSLAERLGEIRQALDDISGTYESIQSNLAKLERNQQRASELWAIINNLDTDSVGHVMSVNTVMRRRRNTIRARYREALRRAKKLAFIARRAIEFRLGVNMSEMGNQMTLVPAPKEWADRVCTLQGFDYEKIADKDDPLFSNENQNEEGNDNYAHMYVGDYVKKLRDFVESYSIDYPFTDESDIAVVSVRDDLLEARKECRTESYNLLLHSGNMKGRVPAEEEGGVGERAWKKKGCNNETDPLCLEVRQAGQAASDTCDETFCFGEDPNIFDSQGVGLRVMDMPVSTKTVDGTEYRNRPQGCFNTGYFSQEIEWVDSGYKILSWWDQMPSDLTASVTYRVEVWTADATPQQLGNLATSADDTLWSQREIRFELETGSPIEVKVYPSNSADGIDFGDVWVWGLQLEHVDPWRCRNYADCSSVPPLPYQETDGEGITSDGICQDTDGSEMRSRFTRKCLCEGQPNAVCEPGTISADSKKCYREYTKTFTLGAIESGKLIPSNNVAIGNFNYRIEDVAVNLVGTDVKDCSHSSTPSTCYANAFTPYTLVHEGEVQVRNFDDDTVEFRMPSARIEHGKALAAEVLVTNPPTSTHSQLLGPYYKTGFKGRPLQGTYRLRIWETPEMNWSAVEDVQLVFKYRYWTRMSYSE